MLEKYVEFLYRNRWLIVIGIPILVFLLAINLKNADIDGSYRIWFEKDSTILQDYDKFKDDFSNDDAITIVFKDKNGIFNREALESIDRISNRLINFKYVEKVSSVLNYQYIHTNKNKPDDILVNDFINLHKINKKYLLDKKNIALKDRNILNAFISKDGTTTMIFARLNTDDKQDISSVIMNDINSIITLETNQTGYRYWVGGGPAMVQAFIKTAEEDSEIFTPLVFILAVILLSILFRRISGSVLPLLVVFLTILIVLSIQVILGYKFNSFTINIPVFIVAIGIADAIHIYGIWTFQRNKGEDNKSAIQFSLKKNFLPILFTSLTTGIGFISLGFSSIVPISTLGIATTTGVIFAFIISVVWLPAMLFMLNKNKKMRVKERVFFQKWNYGKFIIRNDKKIIFIALFIIGIFAMGLYQLKVDTNMIKYFDKNVEVRKSTEFVMENLTGAASYEIIIDSNEVNGIKDPIFLKRIEQFYDEYQKKFPKDIRYMTSIKDVFVKYHKIVTNEEVLPQRREVIAQYLLLYSMSISKRSDITDWLDFDQQKFRITVVTNLVDTSKDIEMINFAKNWWEKTEYPALITGKNAMNAYLQSDVANTIIYSLSITMILVSLMMFILFRRIKILWIMMLPNILPVALVLGMMGWIGINIDIGVAVTGAIIIGVAVDDSIHFLFKYFDAHKNSISKEDVFNEVLNYAGRPIIFTTLVLSISFSVIIFSDFLPNRNFAIITASGVVIAMVLDLLLLPALLSVFDKQKRD